MGKNRGVTKTRLPGPRPRRPRVVAHLPSPDNWAVQWCGPTMAKVVEPGGDKEWVFSGQPYPYDAAIEFAAARLRGDDAVGG